MQVDPGASGHPRVSIKPGAVHVKNTLGNVPERFGTIRDTRQPGAAHPEMFYFKS
jgi:hypothetical protein